MLLCSFIIPVYNMSTYLGDCLISIANQKDLTDVEFIFVDDGSTDNSLDILNNFKLKNKNININIYSKNNGGVSSARNFGINKSNAEYIGFIDPDDYIENNYVEVLKSIISKKNVDIIQFGANRFFDDGKKFNITKNLYGDGIYTLDSDMKRSIFDQSFWVCWTRCFKRQLFEGISFPNIYSSEDLAVLPFIFIRANTIYYFNLNIYNYRYNPNSLSASKKKGYIERAESSYKFIFDDFMSEYDRYPILSATIIPIIRGHIEFLWKNKGYRYASIRWLEFKNKLDNSSFDEKFILKLSNKLFFKLGVPFLIFLILFKRCLNK